MSEILCVYYSRTGTTRAVVEKVAELLGAEVVELNDEKKRGGALGFLRSGFDAMRKTPEPLRCFSSKRPLGAYEHVILATPVWAGRCSSVMRSFLMEKGKQLPEKVSYILTHTGEKEYSAVCGQMDQYLTQPHYMELSLQPKAADYHQKVYDFVRALCGVEAEEESVAAESVTQMESPAQPVTEETAAEQPEKKLKEKPKKPTEHIQDKEQPVQKKKQAESVKKSSYPAQKHKNGKKKKKKNKAKR